MQQQRLQHGGWPESCLAQKVQYMKECHHQ